MLELNNSVLVVWLTARKENQPSIQTLLNANACGSTMMLLERRNDL